MGLFDFFEDIEGSIGDFIFEVANAKSTRESAREMIEQAKEIVRKADDDYNRVYAEVSDYATVVEEKLKRHNDYKIATINRLDSTIQPTLKEFQEFKIDTKINTYHNISNVSLSTKNNSGNLIKFGRSIVSNQDCSIYLTNSFDKAVKEREKACNYRYKIDEKISELKQQKNRMSEISEFIDIEKKEISVILEKIERIREILNSEMLNKTFSHERADYLKNLFNVARIVINTLSSQFLTNNLVIENKYKQEFLRIKEINKRIHLSPKIDDIKSIMVKLSDIIVH